MSFIQFESGREKEKLREELRNAREELLKRAQKNAELRTEKEAQKKLRGESNWILPSISKKIEDSSKVSSKKSKKAKKKSSKEKKKDKKSKKKKKKRRHSSSDDSSSDSESEEEVLKKKSKKRRYSTESSELDDDSSEEETGKWVEKEVKEPPRARDDWMMSGLLLKTYSREKDESKAVEKRNIDDYDPSKCVRELNPHWKNGGKGLPTFQMPKEDDEYKSSYSRDLKPSQKSGNWRKKLETEENSVRNREERHERHSSPKKHRKSQSSSSESGEDEPQQEQKKVSTTNFLTDQQMNELGAKIVKAEIMGNDDLAKELKEKLENARKTREVVKERSINEKKAEKVEKSTESEEHVLLTTTDKKGFTRPLQHRSTEADKWGGRKAKSKKVETHVSGERVRYFADDDRYDIREMFHREKQSTAEDSEAQFVEIAGKHKNPNDDLEDIFADKVRKNISEHDKADKEQKRAISEHERYTKILDNCTKCFDSRKMDKQLLVSLGETAYLSLPYHEGLQSGHCLITPMQHVTCSTMLDEDTWSEITDFRKALTRMFAAKGKDVIFFEIARYLNRRPHMVIHCIPGDNFEMAPFYFKKAIQESEYDWSTNKQLISLKDKSLRRAIPKGLPYFWVNFGMDSGFAHVIEDQESFPANFAEEIIGGMLHLDPKTWRHPRKEHNTIPKVKQLADWWKPFDCTSKD